MGHVGADIDLGERAQAGKGGSISGTDSRHRKRGQSNPSNPVVQIDFQFVGDHWAEEAFVDSPMQEKQVAPSLTHQPGPGWARGKEPIRFEAHHAVSQTHLWGESNHECGGTGGGRRKSGAGMDWSIGHWRRRWVSPPAGSSCVEHALAGPSHFLRGKTKPLTSVFGGQC